MVWSERSLLLISNISTHAVAPQFVPVVVVSDGTPPDAPVLHCGAVMIVLALEPERKHTQGTPTVSTRRAF